MESPSQSRPEISVIIMAYNRRDFVKDALHSVLTQTLPRVKYEIILLKNYYDTEIDKYAASNNVILIFCSEKIIGRMVWTGIEAARGEIISFLDDDDLFTPNKLEVVSELLSDKSVGYYHNSVQIISNNPLGSKLFRFKQFSKATIFGRIGSSKTEILKLLDNNATFNSSSVSVRRDFLNQWKSLIGATTTGPGFTLFFISLLSSKLNFMDSRRLTVFRSHSSLSNPHGKPSERIKGKVTNLENAIAALSLIANVTENVLYRSIMNYKITELRIWCCFYGDFNNELVGRQLATGILRGSPSYKTLYRFLLALIAIFWRKLPNPIRQRFLWL